VRGFVANISRIIREYTREVVSLLGSPAAALDGGLCES
jgi:hypothetical protein